MKWVTPALSLFLIFISVVVMIASHRLGIGDVRTPGPGFMGFFAAVLMLCLSAVIFVKDSLKVARGEMKGFSIPTRNLAKILILLAALSLYALALGYLGFLVCTFLLTFLMFYIFSPSPRKWPRQVLVALLVTNVTYLVFCKFLQVILPAGVFRIGW